MGDDGPLGAPQAPQGGKTCKIMSPLKVLFQFGPNIVYSILRTRAFRFAFIFVKVGGGGGAAESNWGPSRVQKVGQLCGTLKLFSPPNLKQL